MKVSRDKKDAANTMSRTGRKTSDRLQDRSAIFPMQRAYDQERDKTVAQAKRMFKGSLTQDTDMKQRAQLLKLLESRADDITNKMREIMKTTTREATTEGMRHVQKSLSLFFKKATILDDPTEFAKLRRVIEKRLSKDREEYLKDFAYAFNKDLRFRLIDRPDNLDPQVRDMVEAVEPILDSNWWRIERMARTETSMAYNMAIQAAIEAVSKDFKIKIWLRWCELIDESTQVPLDDRVCGDSMVMHGQVALPGKSFTMPKLSLREFDAEAARYQGQTWSCPPNRPNDRAVLSLWVPETGLMAYVVRNGKRVYLNP